MYKRTSWLKMVCLAAAATALFACAKGNSDAPVVDNSGKHPADWIAQHGAVALPSTSACKECHGAELTGGISRISCMSAATIQGFGCHATNPADNPGHSFHPANWIPEHKATAAVSTASCTQCHASDLTGGIAKVGCMSAGSNGFKCHVTSPAATPSGCISCHNGDRGVSVAPFGPNDTKPSIATYPTAPNHNNGHSTHTGLVNAAGAQYVGCSSCHTGAGYGTAVHANGTANIALAGIYAAKTGTFSYDPANGTCSAASCHGGQVTPSWSTGSINVDTDCLKCHELGTASQTPQYNSFYSGIAFGINLHKLHLLLNVPHSTTPIFCTDCHSKTKLANLHFVGLSTPAFEGPPADTIGDLSTLISTYTASPSGTCTTICHVQRNWLN